MGAKFRVANTCGSPIPLAVDAPAALRQTAAMSTLAEIEAAADALPPEQQQELFLFLAVRLRGDGAPLPPPREFSREQIAAWVADDEEGMRRFKEGE